MSNEIRTILIGTARFAAEIFKKTYPVLKDRFNIISIITAPDKLVGRKQVLSPSPVKKWALRANLRVLEPIKIADSSFINEIKGLNPDLIILCAYSQFIPKEILEIPKYGSLNIHPSLLPKYRGASPIQTAILNNDTETGVTLMLMDEKMDHGSIISNSKIQISKPTYEELEDELIDVAIDLLICTLFDYVHGKIKPRPQDHSKATFCKLIKKQHGKIGWSKSAKQIEAQIRAFNKWPTAYTNDLKILKAEILNENRNKKPGKVFTENKELMIQTGNGILILKQVQPQGKKPMPGKDFLNGHPEIIGTNLG